MIIIIVLNLDSGVVLEQKLGHWSMLRSRAELIRVNIKIKVVIIIILKLDSRVNSGQNLGHE